MLKCYFVQNIRGTSEDISMKYLIQGYVTEENMQNETLRVQ